MRARQVLIPLLPLLAAAGLAACGGGGSSTSSTAAQSGSPTSSAPQTKTGAAAHAAKPAPPPGPSASAERRAAGRAAPFVKPKSDNSVPTFGSEASASERGEAEAALKAYLRARARGDWAASCNLLAASTREGFEKLAASSKAKVKGCAPVLAAFSKGADRTDPLTAGLLSLRVKGANAFALFYGPGHQQYMVPMVREGGSWRPTQTAPIAYPPGAPSTAP